MNINDVEEKHSDMTEGDMLEAIFQKQRDLMKKYHEIESRNGFMTPDAPVDLDCRFGQARLKDFAWRVTEELGEAMNCLKNKPWKQTHMVTDKNHFYEEIGDALHFFIELCVLAGLDARSLYSLYFKKAEVNHFRQRSSY